MKFDNLTSERYSVSPDALAQQLHGEVIMLDMKTEAYFGLNETGSLVWEKVAAGETVGAIAQSLIDRYGLSHEDAFRDVTALISELEKRELIIRRNS